MMYQTKDRFYVYHGYALAAGGYVASDGARQNIDSAASVVLPITGGAGHVRQSGYNFCWCGKTGGGNFYFRIEEASSEVYGFERAGGYVTRARTVLRGLDINGVITADVVESMVESEHTTEACAGREEARIGIGTSHFEGLRVAGVSIEPTRSAVFDTCETYGRLRNLVDPPRELALDSAQQELRERFCHSSLIGPPPSPDPGRALVQEAQYVQDLRTLYVNPDVIRCSIFDELDTAGQLRTRGYSINLEPEFGRVFLGELLVTHGMKRLNMIRFNLGCDPSGDGVGGGSSVNGVPMP